MSFRPLPVMTVCVVVSLVILAMLGNWQWQRYNEKLTARDTVPEWTAISGEIVEDGVFYISTIMNGRSAWLEVLALETETEIVLGVNGVVFSVDAPEDFLFDTEDPEPELGEGLFRTPAEPSAFTLQADTQKNLLFAYDFSFIEAKLGRSVRREVFEPRRLIARDETGEGMIDNPFADPVLADPLPPARHLGYAWTWWGMALALFIMYFIYHASVGRLSLRNKT